MAGGLPTVSSRRPKKMIHQQNFNKKLKILGEQYKAETMRFTASSVIYTLLCLFPYLKRNHCGNLCRK